MRSSAPMKTGRQTRARIKVGLGRLIAIITSLGKLLPAVRQTRQTLSSTRSVPQSQIQAVKDGPEEASGEATSKTRWIGDDIQVDSAFAYQGFSMDSKLNAETAKSAKLLLVYFFH